MDFAIQKRAGGQHHGARANVESHLGSGPDYPVALHQKIVHRLLKEPQIWLILKAASDGCTIKDAVSLSAGGAHRRTLARIQNPKLNPCLVGGRRHGAAERIDFLDQMTLADASNRGIA